jgi:hypothetical protein
MIIQSFLAGALTAIGDRRNSGDREKALDNDDEKELCGIRSRGTSVFLRRFSDAIEPSAMQKPTGRIRPLV